MARKSTIAWRSFVLALIVGSGSLALNADYAVRRVDTDAMLDVSVSIKTISHVRIDEVGDSVWESGSGSGFLVSAERCEVWTNHHVIDNAAVIEVFPRARSGSEGIPASVVNSTPRTDLAVLRLASCDGIPEAVLGDSGSLEPGDETYAVGNPLGHNPDSISRGIISHTERFVNTPFGYLQTDAAINPGNSGGALFNLRGEVIGINSAIAATRSGSNVGIGYALPINIARAVASELREGPPSWGDAGLAGRISTLTPEEAVVFRVPSGRGGVVITTTPDTGPGVGALYQHDVIYRIGDTEVIDTGQALRLVSNLEAGASVKFDLIREGAPVSAELILDEGWKESTEGAPDYYDGHLGMTLETWTGEEGDRGKFEKPVITRVHSLGPAHRAHIASSQRTFGFQGPFLVAYQLDVKMVTGAVLEGNYHRVDDIETLDTLSNEAYDAGTPLLLEIELWARSNPANPQSNLERKGTAFFRIDPALTSAKAPAAEGEQTAASDGPEREPASSKVSADGNRAEPVKHASVFGWRERFYR